ncbi:MAG: tetrahydromethanopterin S-methyltransferase subunit A [Proteobacteria bacterium]|nr:tetrahydromethanopterin S-methyltransferase subunit A [Pseudomonadota bacterium]
MLKVAPHPDYPLEEGRYIRGNDFSPVAVAIILNCDADKIPREIESLVRAGAESGAALSGTVQTPNIGFEKMICNIVANPNIRYLILGGPESAGHLTGEALKALFENGVDDKKRIIGTEASHATLFNVPLNFIERFRSQLTLINIQFEGDPEVIRQAVWTCYQENPVDFRGYSLYDPGAFSEPSLSGKITWRINQPWAEPEDENEQEALRKAKELIEKLKSRTKKVGE